MKKLFVILAGFVVLQACNPSNENPGESGTVNDGFQGAGDPSGGLPGDTLYTSPGAKGIDTAAEDHRVDTERRDSAGGQ